MKTSLILSGLLSILCLSGCQRPTQGLVPAPQFPMEKGDSEVSNSPAASPTPVVRDDVSLPEDAIRPGSLEDFLRYSGGDLVYFEYDRSELLPTGRELLERQARWLAKYPGVRVSLEGHADERGTREYNFALGERRAAAMQFYLLSLGLNPSRISVTSLGKERPAAAGSNEDAWAMNRRGQTVLIGASSQ